MFQLMSINWQFSKCSTTFAWRWKHLPTPKYVQNVTNKQTKKIPMTVHHWSVTRFMTHAKHSYTHPENMKGWKANSALSSTYSLTGKIISENIMINFQNSVSNRNLSASASASAGGDGAFQSILFNDRNFRNIKRSIKFTLLEYSYRVIVCILSACFTGA